MGRLRANRNIEHSKAAIVDSAMYACKPPPARPPATRTRTPLQRYIRHLLMDCVGGNKATSGDKGARTGESVDVVARMRALPWDECEDDVLQTVLEVRRNQACKLGSTASHGSCDLLSESCS